MAEKVVSSQVGNLSLKDRLTLVDLEKTLLDIHFELEDFMNKQPPGFIASFMFPANDVRIITLSKLFTNFSIFIGLTGHQIEDSTKCRKIDV